jgi:hypothetical protein
MSSEARGATGRVWWAVAAVLLAVAVALTQWSARREDPAAAEGVRVATALLMTADAQIELRPANAGESAARAALVRATWDEAAQSARMAALQPPDGTIPEGETQDGGAAADAARPAHFVVTGWAAVESRPHRASVRVMGHYDRLRDGAWYSDPGRQWQIELTRLDPVGITRGWHLSRVS